MVGERGPNGQACELASLPMTKVERDKVEPTAARQVAA